MKEVLFNIDLTADKKEILSRVNTLKGLYGILVDHKQKNRLCKLVSARIPDNKNTASFSMLVQPNAGVIDQHKWKMVRINVERNTKITVSTLTAACSLV